MDNKKILSLEIRLILTALRHETRLDIIDLLYNNPQMSLSEISSELKQERNSLLYHLKEIEHSGLIRNIRQKVGD